MTPLELVLFLIVWVFVGSFICHKRNWYRTNNVYSDTPQELMVICTICISPVALVIALFKEFILDEWNNKT